MILRLLRLFGTGTSPGRRVRDALRGRNDAHVRHKFTSHFARELNDAERALSDAYNHFLEFDRQFSRKDRDRAAVVGTVFTTLARTTMSVNLLTLGQLALSGAAFRQ